jgi:hypothetical protein
MTLQLVPELQIAQVGIHCGQTRLDVVERLLHHM